MRELLRNGWRASAPQMAMLLVLLMTWAGHPLASLPVPVADTAPASPAFLQGSARWSLEWGCGDGHDMPADFAAMRTWHQNTVSITVSSDLWFSSACPGYRAAVQDAVSAANAAGLYVVLTLQWVNPWPGRCKGPGAQYPMPDMAEGLPFWQQAGAMLAGDQVGFQLFSEPHDVSAAVWRYGGTVTQPRAPGRCAGTYRAVGMQRMTDALARVAPGHLVYVSGLSWARDLSFVRGRPITGSDVRYSVHLYEEPDWNDPAEWNRTFGFLGRKVIGLEFGSFTSSGCPVAPLGAIMGYLKPVTGGMVAWAWTTGSCGMLASWDGTPSAYGAPIRKEFLA
jgi:Cellulase (glycosyl hydrolase family 5)